MAPRDATASSLALPRYTCDILQIDCGGGYCCPVGQVCFASGHGDDDDRQTTCRLAPGIPGTDQPASPAQGVVVLSRHPTTTPSPSPSSSSSTNTTAAAATSTTTPPSPTLTPASASPFAHATSSPLLPGTGGISGTGIAGIVVGVLLLTGLLGGSVWSLWRRRRRERARVREDAFLAEGGGGGLGGGVGGGRSGGPGSRSEAMKDFFAGAKAGAGVSSREGGGQGRLRPWRERERGQGRRESRPSPLMAECEASRQEWGQGQGRQGTAAAAAAERGEGEGEGDGEGGLVYMYGGSNVGRSAGEVPGRVEAVGDLPPTPPPTYVVLRKPLASQRRERAPVYEMDGSSPMARAAARRLTG